MPPEIPKAVEKRLSERKWRAKSPIGGVLGDAEEHGKGYTEEHAPKQAGWREMTIQDGIMSGSHGDPIHIDEDG